MDLDSMTWTCHVCGDERPDRLISVYRRSEEVGGGVVVSMNVRYCNDRPACRDGAKDVSFLPKAT